jgi:Fic family protein
MYLYEDLNWPNFTWDNDLVMPLLSDIKGMQGRLVGKMEGLGFSLQEEANLQTMTSEILKSNEIEGEHLDADQVRSSIAKRLGLDIAGLVPSDRQVDGVVDMMLDALQNSNQRLSKQRLFAWHASLSPTKKNSLHKITVGAWRKNSLHDPMQVVSGPIWNQKVHFQAPDSKVLDKEMKVFLAWFNSSTSIDEVLKAAIAHLWFLTIHPFDDGNGRIARTITDMLLARSDRSIQRFYSMSAQIRIERKAYYSILESAQKSTLDITDWMLWFLKCLGNAIKTAEENLSSVLRKAHYWEWLRSKKLNERQQLMINHLLNGFEGKLNTTKWAKITKCSHDTALRDITNLIQQGVLHKEEGGSKNTSYVIAAVKSK